MLQERLAHANILNLLFAVDLALNGENTVVAALLEASNQFGEVDVSLTERGLLTKGVAAFGIYAILCVHVANVLAQEVKGIYGVCLAVKDEVCGVEVNTYVIKPDILNGTCKREGRLLSCFKQKILTVLLQ